MRACFVKSTLARGRIFCYTLLMADRKKCVIVGGGAAGIMCAARLIARGVKPVIVEASARVGKKILVSGNGRCNLSNANVSAEKYNAPKFVAPVLERYPFKELIEWWKRLGLITRTDGEGRVYPHSNYAGSVLNILLAAVREAEMITSCPVKDIKAAGGGFEVICQNAIISAENAVLACGSGAGGGRASYNLLSGAGHTVTPLTPAVTYLVTDKFKGLKGVRAKVSAVLDTQFGTWSDRGEILLKEDGVSGILAFWLSSFLARNRCSGTLSIDFAPDMTEEELKREYGDRRELLCGLLHKALADKLLREGGLELVKNYRVKVTPAKTDSQVMCGGAAVEEWGEDMQSKLHKGLYCIGEMADIDGECGGYNLHWAWVSALAAADSIADRL